MRFWDSSAIIPVLVAEPATETLLTLMREPTPPMVWWATPVECESAITRRERNGALDTASAQIARDELRRLEETWVEVGPSAETCSLARRVIRVHPLRTADALQLAAALAAADGHPGDLEFVCLDQRLIDAARREGFPVLP